MFASSIWAKYSKTILHSRPRAGRTRSSMLSSTSLHVRNRSRGLSTPRQARQAQPARGDAAHTLDPRDHLANSQSQTRPDVRPIIRDSALPAALMRGQPTKSPTRPPTDLARELLRSTDLESGPCRLPHSPIRPVSLPPSSRSINHRQPLHLYAPHGCGSSNALRQPLNSSIIGPAVGLPPDQPLGSSHALPWLSSAHARVRQSVATERSFYGELPS